MGKEMAVVPVGPFPKSVVAAAILIMVVPNAGGEGCGQRLRVSIVSRIVVVLIGGDGNGGDLGPASVERVCHGFGADIDNGTEMRANW